MSTKISERHAIVLSVVELEPGMNYSEIRQRLSHTGVEESSVNCALMGMTKKGLLRREGIKRRYTFTPTGEPYEVVPGQMITKPVGQKRDLLLEKLTSLDLSDEQWLFLREHQYLPRRQLAAMMGIEKIVLNHALTKL